MAKKKAATNEDPKGTVVIKGNASQIPHDDMCRILFGMSMSELIHDIQINANGKYDQLFRNK